MPTPSLILVPARFKTGKLYTPVATTSGGVVLGASGDFNVTRATTATRVNASGLIESVASGIPRLDYYTSGGTAGCPALLVEPAATNGAPDVKHLKGPGLAAASGGPTITTGSTDFLAPDGTSGSITKYVGGAASGSVQNAFYTGFTPTISAAGAYTFSLFVKAGATNPLNFCALQFTSYTGGSGTAASYFSLASGTALTSGATIQNYGNGWYRLISAPYTIAAGDLVGNVLFNFAEGNGDVTWPVSGALNLTAYAWGAQIEAGSVPTSYIPTTTAAVTRNTEVISVAGEVSGCIGQTEGVVYWEGNALLSGVQDVLLINRNTTNSVTIYKDGNNFLNLRIHASGGTNLDRTITDNVSRTGFLKLAVAYKSGDSTFYINGTRVGTLNTTAFTFTAALNTIRFGEDAFLLGRGDQRCRAVAIYSTRLTDTELAALTTL